MSDNKTCFDEKLPNYKPYSYSEIFVNELALIKSDKKVWYLYLTIRNIQDFFWLGISKFASSIFTMGSLFSKISE